MSDLRENSGEPRANGRVFILTGEPPQASGGMEHAIRELSEGLGRAGFKVEVLHFQNCAPKWISMPRNKWQNYLRDVLISWYEGRRIANERENEIVAVISNGPYGWYIPRLRPEIKKIHFYHGTYRGQAEALAPFISQSGALKLKWWDSMVLERFSGRGKCIACNSDQTREEVAKLFGYSGETVWLPLDTAHFAPMDKAAARKELGFDGAEKIGLFVGSTHATKGFPVVRALMDALANVKWLLALRGDVPAEAVKMDRVRVFQDARHELLPTLYNAADFTVCPSRYEAFGYVVAEALACGTPVVSSAGGASRLFLRGSPFKNFLIERADAAEDYLRAITPILADPELYRRLVIESIRPEIERTMAPKNWLRRFRECAGI